MILFPSRGTESARPKPALAALEKLKEHQALLRVILKFHLLLPGFLLSQSVQVWQVRWVIRGVVPATAN